MADCKGDVLIRLRKIEGQIRGLHKMIEQDKECTEVVHQLSAARKALDKVGFIILTHQMQDCLQKSKENGESEKAMEEAMALFLTLS
jgi:CsoR family transcriptional regulator, copper-sensing transcriptional repressor